MRLTQKLWLIGLLVFSLLFSGTASLAKRQPFYIGISCPLVSPALQNGQYTALYNVTPITLEWALGERNGIRLSPVTLYSAEKFTSLQELWFTLDFPFYLNPPKEAKPYAGLYLGPTLFVQLNDLDTKAHFLGLGFNVGYLKKITDLYSLRTGFALGYYTRVAGPQTSSQYQNGWAFNLTLIEFGGWSL